MRFDTFVVVQNGVVGADPIAAPGNVLDAFITRIRNREPQYMNAVNRLILSLEGIGVEDVDIELYLLDDEDEEAAAADRRWYLLAQIPGLTRRTLDETTAAFVGGGLLYVRVTAETVAANRRLLIRAATS